MNLQPDSHVVMITSAGCNAPELSDPLHWQDRVGTYGSRCANADLAANGIIATGDMEIFSIYRQKSSSKYLPMRSN